MAPNENFGLCPKYNSKGSFSVGQLKTCVAEQQLCAFKTGPTVASVLKVIQSDIKGKRDAAVVPHPRPSVL